MKEFHFLNFTILILIYALSIFYLSQICHFGNRWLEGWHIHIKETWSFGDERGTNCCRYLRMHIPVPASQAFLSWPNSGPFWEEKLQHLQRMSEMTGNHCPHTFLLAHTCDGPPDLPLCTSHLQQFATLNHTLVIGCKSETPAGRSSFWSLQFWDLIAMQCEIN